MTAGVCIRCHRDALRSVKQEGPPSCRLLLGYAQTGQITVLSSTGPLPSTHDITQDAESVCLLLPAGISVVGVLLNCCESDKERSLDGLQTKWRTSDLQALLSVEHLVLLVSSLTEDVPQGYLQTGLGELVTSPVTVTDDHLFSTLLILRLRASVPLSITVSSCDEKTRNHIMLAVSNLLKDVKSDISNVVFHINDSSILLHQDEEPSVPESSTCGDLSDHIITDNEEPEYLRKKKKKGQQNRTIHVSLLFQVTGEKTVLQSGAVCSPVIDYITESYHSVNVSLPLDVVALVDPNMPLDRLWGVLCGGVVSQLTAMQNSLLEQVKQKQVETFEVPTVFHFCPLDGQTIFSVVYPDGPSEDDLEKRRRALHQLLGFPVNRPLFRKANAFVFPEDVNSGGYLRDPHSHLPYSSVPGGKQYMVQGHYTYHHYMQDRFDDDRWGCAYRSLQTLVSWFVLQGYSTVNIPSHREIQQVLVDVGDKEAKFVGSRQWIGSFEVSICLDHFLGVSSKILSVNEGADLAYKGRELAVHFETQGTPIMIGGGVLAHTILGVDFNSETGAVRFLILDPHYTGAEDLKVILDKGWCGWKGPEFWDKTAHYNLCMPQRPAAV